MVTKDWDCGSTGREVSLIFPKNGKTGGFPRIPDSGGDMSDSEPLTSKNNWVAAILLKKNKIKNHIHTLRFMPETWTQASWPQKGELLSVKRFS